MECREAEPHNKMVEASVDCTHMVAEAMEQ